MICSVIIQDMGRECERRVCVDSEEELKNMTVKEFIRRFCPPEKRRRRYIELYILKKPEDDQTRGDCDRKHESVQIEPGCSGDISNQSMVQGSESVDFPHDRTGSVTDRSDFSPILWLRSTVTEYLNYDQTLGYHGIRKGSTIFEMDFSYDVTAPPADEDEDEGFTDHP